MNGRPLRLLHEDLKLALVGGREKLGANEPCGAQRDDEERSNAHDDPAAPPEGDVEDPLVPRVQTTHQILAGTFQASHHPSDRTARFVRFLP